MPRLPAFVFAAAALALAASADAQVYKWKDANGTVHYSDAPPIGTSYQKVQVNTNMATPVTPAPIPKDNASGNSVAQAATQPAPASTAPVPDTADNRAKLCKQLDSNIALLNSNSPVLSNGNGGSPKDLNDAQRKQALTSAQSQKKQYCNAH